MSRICVRLLAAFITFSMGSVCSGLFSYGVARYKLGALRAQEQVLREDLYRMRKAIHLHEADTGRPPWSLGGLVEAGYLSEVPVDWARGLREWEQVRVPCPAEYGVSHCRMLEDVRSRSKAVSSEGTPYNEW